MAQFEIIDDEGVRFVKITLRDESVCAERGALCYMVGDIKVRASLPSLPGVVKSALSEQAFIRPRYSGTGTIYLESSFAGFSELELTGEPWILSSGVFWASEEGVDLSVHLENMVTQLFVQDDLINFQTKVKGKGTVIIRSQGPVVKVQVDGQRVVTDGRYVIARTEGVKYISRRSAQTILGSLISGESFRLRAFEGKGTVLISSYPFWKYRLMQMRQTGEMDPKDPME